MAAPTGPVAADTAPCSTKPHLQKEMGPLQTKDNPEPWQATGSRPRRQQTSMDNLMTRSVGGCSKPTEPAAIPARA